MIIGTIDKDEHSGLTEEVFPRSRRPSPVEECGSSSEERGSMFSVATTVATRSEPNEHSRHGFYLVDLEI